MTNSNHAHDCPDCGGSVSRRDFVRKTGAVLLGAGAVPALFNASLYAAPGKDSPAETAVGKLYQSLSDAQKSKICFAFDHEKRKTINANWAIAEPEISDDFYTADQRSLIAEIFKGVTSEEGHAQFLKQTEYDSGGWDRYHIAIFGEPGTDKFQWEMTGRHLTIRADGNSVPGAAFGGPVVYGHGESDPRKNLFHYQTKQANEVFQALDTKQREAALLEKAPGEADVLLQGEKGRFRGISVGELSSDQQALVESVIKTILAPYREADVAEAMEFLNQGGGLKSLHMAFYQQGDLLSDQVWDIWRVEGPNFVSHFRGAPHVHAYLNVGVKQS